MRFVVRLSNDSEESVNVISATRLGQNMEYMYYEVEQPGGVVERRRHRAISYYRADDMDWVAEPLRSRETLQLVLYPNLSVIESPGTGRGFTFGEPGVCRVRVALSVPARYETLWQPDGGVLFSNWITLEMLGPTPIEKELLDAYWTMDANHSVYGDRWVHLKGVDMRRLLNLLNEHADQRLSRYLEFNVARVMVDEAFSGTARVDDAISRLQSLIERYPSFRFTEVRLHLASAYVLAGNVKAANQVMAEAVRREPSLAAEYDFVRRWIANVGTTEQLASWELARREGRKSDVPVVEIRRALERVSLPSTGEDKNDR